MLNFKHSATKRFISLIIVASLLFVTLTGCGVLLESFSELITDIFADEELIEYSETLDEVNDDGRGQREEESDLFLDELTIDKVTEKRLADVVVDESLGEEEFDLFLNELFVDIVTSDSISLNYTLADPSVFGIEDIVPTLGEVSTPETARRDRQESLEGEKKLHSFNYDLLRPDQQIIFDILARSYALSHALEFNEEHIYYLGSIRPLNGIQVQLPILLAEFNFRTVEDFEIYFALLQDTPRYFSELIEHERERSRRGFFLSAENVDDVIEQIESYLSNREDNFLILVVNDIIDEFDGLTQEQRNEFKERNRELVLNYFLPAYENLESAMRELRGVGARQDGLVNLPDGEAFVQMRLHHRTDSDMSVRQMHTSLTQRMEQIQERLWDIWAAYPELGDLSALGEIAPDSPENIMRTLELSMSRDFPPLDRVNYVIHEVHESLQEHISPAFYISPAIDDFIDNVIYVNHARIRDDFFLFTIMAHEGFPGHMYQFVYFFQQSPHPIRTFLSGIGYTEGWAAYAEYESFFWAGLDEREAEVLRLVREFDLLFMSIIDLNVNAFGWSLDDVSAFLRGRGITDPEVAENIFNMTTGVPLFYLPYSIGYIEMAFLREEAERLLGGDFVAMDFHRFILEFGPAPFSLIHEHLVKWAQS